MRYFENGAHWRGREPKRAISEPTAPGQASCWEFGRTLPTILLSFIIIKGIVCVVGCPWRPPFADLGKSRRCAQVCAAVVGVVGWGRSRAVSKSCREISEKFGIPVRIARALECGMAELTAPCHGPFESTMPWAVPYRTSQVLFPLAPMPWECWTPPCQRMFVAPMLWGVACHAIWCCASHAMGPSDTPLPRPLCEALAMGPSDTPLPWAVPDRDVSNRDVSRRELRGLPFWQVACRGCLKKWTLRMRSKGLDSRGCSAAGWPSEARRRRSGDAQGVLLRGP